MRPVPGCLHSLYNAKIQLPIKHSHYRCIYRFLFYPAVLYGFYNRRNLSSVIGRKHYVVSCKKCHHCHISILGIRRHCIHSKVVGHYHAIEAHHGDVEPQTVIACLVQAADAISAARPGARRENVENYVKRLEKLEELTSSFPGVEKAYAIQAGREVRIMVKPEEVTEDNMIILAREIAKKIENELEYPGQIKVNLIRETKAVEYAK